MKLTKIVMCAVAAGVVACAVNKAQAAVIGNELFIPVNVKLKVSYVDSGKIKQGTVTSKQFLAYENFPKGTMMAYYDGDIYAISKTAVLENLTEDDYVFANLTEYIYTETTGKETEAGVNSLEILSDADEIFADNQYAFELGGTYAWKGSESKDNSNGIYTESLSFKSSNLSGYGYDYDLSDSELPVTGTVSASGSGKLVD